MDREYNNALEKNVGSQTKREVVLGLDISTTCTAVTILDYNTGDIIDIIHTVMNNKKKFPDFWSKVKNMEELIDKHLSPEYSVVAVAVEESAKRFPAGASSAGTIITLSKFNAIICYMLFKKFDLEPTELNVRMIRKLLGIKIDRSSKTTTKQQVVQQVKTLVPNFPLAYRNTKEGPKELKINEDRVDSWVVAMAYKKLHAGS